MLLIQNGYMIDPKSGREGKLDILTEGARILRIGKGLEKPEGCEVIDAEGLLAAPGLVDVHVHFRDPGFPEKEDISTGAAAAARGGFTTVVMMANTKPPIDNPGTLAGVLELAGRAAIALLVPSVGFSAACFASPVAWILADLFLIPAYLYCYHRLTWPRSRDRRPPKPRLLRSARA